jgi:hypothetical protein
MADLVEQVLSTHRCPCGRRLDRHNVLGVGLVWGREFPDSVKGLRALIAVSCDKCQRMGCFTTSTTIKQLNDAITDEAAAQLLIIQESLRRRSRGMGNRPSVRRLRRRDPITDEQVAAFLKVLRRTSFRRSSKSFRRWMRRLGVKI